MDFYYWKSMHLQLQNLWTFTIKFTVKFDEIAIFLKVEIWVFIFPFLKDCRRFWIVTYPLLELIYVNV